MMTKVIRFWIIAVVSTNVFTIVKANEDESTKSPIKRSYVCPPHFVRLSSKCYFFSKKMATWQDAYWKCRDLHSNLAIIRNSNQDKLIRRTLSKDSLVPLERWLGGRYDWEQMTWKWAASGKIATYKGFLDGNSNEDKENLRWHCIILDPVLHYRWSSRSCFEKKHFICHTKIKIVTSKGKKKLQRQYNVDKLNQLNEIPVPDLPEDVYRNTTILKDNVSHDIIQPNEQDNELYAQFAKRPKPNKKKRKGKKRKNKKKQLEENEQKVENGTVIYEVPKVKEGKHLNNRRRRNKSKESKESKELKNASIENIKWKTYYSQVTISPLHPRRIVEEFSFSKK